MSFESYIVRSPIDNRSWTSNPLKGLHSPHTEGGGIPLERSQSPFGGSDIECMTFFEDRRSLKLHPREQQQRSFSRLSMPRRMSAETSLAVPQRGSFWEKSPETMMMTSNSLDRLGCQSLSRRSDSREVSDEDERIERRTLGESHPSQDVRSLKRKDDDNELIHVEVSSASTSELLRMQTDPSESLDRVWSNLHVGISILFWYASSMTITALNKYLFDSSGFTYPLLVTFIHFTLISLALQFAVSNCRYCPSRPEISRQNYFRFIVPIAFFGAAEVALSNVAYSMVSLSMMTVIKSSLVVVTYLFAILFNLEKFSCKLFAVVVFIMASISLTVPGLAMHHKGGVIILCLAVLMAAARWVIVHHQLKKSNFTPIQLMVLTQPLSSVFLAGPAFVVDLRHLISSQEISSDWPKLLAANLLIGCSVILAFLVMFSEYNLVNVTSSVSLTVAGVGKEIATILMSVVSHKLAAAADYEIAFDEYLDPIPLCGIGLSIIGIIVYSRLRLRQSITHLDHLPLATSQPMTSNESEEYVNNRTDYSLETSTSWLSTSPPVTWRQINKSHNEVYTPIGTNSSPTIGNINNVLVLPRLTSIVQKLGQWSQSTVVDQKLVGTVIVNK